jgi:Protein of unknown function (DUF1566)/SPOR domain
MVDRVNPTPCFTRLVRRRSKRVDAALVAALLLVAFMFSATGAAAGPAAYFSVHLASFKNLKNANAFVNSLAQKGKVVFWKEAQVPSKGLFYRVYMGRFVRFDNAEAFWEKLKAEGKVSYRGIHRFQGPLAPPPSVQPSGLLPDIDIGELARPAPPAKSIRLPASPAPATRTSPVRPMPEPPPVPPEKIGAPPAKGAPLVGKTKPPGRFRDNGDGTVTDWENGLMWIKNGWRIDFFSAETWTDAVEKCSRFGFAGYSDWRLPTLAQWRSIIDAAYECPALVEPNPFENVIVHMPYWSATPVKKVPINVYTVTLYHGTVGHQHKSGRGFILPVRAVR